MVMSGKTWNFYSVSLSRRVKPTKRFGCVKSVFRFLGTGSIAWGAFSGGDIAYRFGIRAPYLASVIVGLSSLAIGGPRLYKEVQRYIAPEETPAPPSIT